MDENESKRPETNELTEPFDLESTTDLLAEVRDGSARAREVLYDRYLGRLQRWARGRLPHGARDLMDTDDLVQQTLTNVLVRMDEFEPNNAGSFQAYLRRVLLNQIRDQIRRVARRPTFRDTPGVVEEARAAEPSPLELAVGTETAERYERALAKLKPSDREIVIAHVELCFDYSEIACEFGKSSPNAARMAVSRALRRLAVEMGTS